MNIYTMARGIITTFCLLAVSAFAQACYYEGDPVLTPSGYDVPVTSTDSDCYYGGDPVMEKSGQYDTPITLAEGSYYYTADLQEGISYSDNSIEMTDFSAFEHEADTETTGVVEVTAAQRDLGDHEWLPQAWTRTY